MRGDTPPGRLNTAPAIAQGRGDWRDDALCAQPEQDPEDWYTHDAETSPAIATSLCIDCPTLAQCREWILETEPPKYRYGVVAGLTPAQRTRLHAGRTIRDRVMESQIGGGKAC